jgi:hypothetical protein
MINCQKELTELEYDQRVLARKIAGHKATLLANAKKGGMENGNREGDRGRVAYLYIIKRSFQLLQNLI